MATLPHHRADSRRLRPAAPCRAARRLLGLLACACLVAIAPQADGAGPCAAPDVWVASTRRLPCVCRPPDDAGIQVERLAAGRWRPADVAELLGDGNSPLVIFIHGNRYAHGEARGQGLELARLVERCRPDAGPVRTVVFSWPSDQQGMLLRDVRLKYDRAHADGHYLAWLLDRVDPGRDVAIVGYSYGAIVGLEALRDRTRSPGAEARAGRRGRTHLVLVAPAVRFDALAPRGPYRDSLAEVDRFTLVANSADYALAFFHCVDRDVGAAALGSTSMPRRWLPDDIEYSAVDAADVVGPQHRLPPYLGSATIGRRIAAGAVEGFGAAAR